MFVIPCCTHDSNLKTGDFNMNTATASTIKVDRKQLVKALDQIKRVVPSKVGKPSLRCVRIQAEKGRIRLAATDLETSVNISLWGDGEGIDALYFDRVSNNLILVTSKLHKNGKGGLDSGECQKFIA